MGFTFEERSDIISKNILEVTLCIIILEAKSKV